MVGRCGSVNPLKEMNQPGSLIIRKAIFMAKKKAAKKKKK
jgi:hypothetical protein